MYNRIKNIVNIDYSTTINNFINSSSIDESNDNSISDILKLQFEKEELLHTKYNDITYNLMETLDKIDISNFKLPEEEFDCIIGGGGLKGYYIYGSMLILKKMIFNKNKNALKALYTKGS